MGREMEVLFIFPFIQCRCYWICAVEPARTWISAVSDVYFHASLVCVGTARICEIIYDVGIRLTHEMK